MIGVLPASVDWRDDGVVTPVKDQGGCGSCWAFSTIETVESNVALTTGRLIALSAQEVVNCTCARRFAFLYLSLGARASGDGPHRRQEPDGLRRYGRLQRLDAVARLQLHHRRRPRRRVNLRLRPTHTAPVRVLLLSLMLS